MIAGTIKCSNAARRFGVITPDDGGSDVFEYVAIEGFGPLRSIKICPLGNGAGRRGEVSR